MKRSTKAIAEVCLYGAMGHGYGWLATFGRELLGDGELRHDSASSAMWTAFTALSQSGIHCGPCNVFAPGGKLVAIVHLHKTWPTFGDLKWQPAVQYAISSEAIVAASEKIPAQSNV